MKFQDKNRIEAFSDGVIAILITLLVLEIKVPHIENVTTSSILDAMSDLLPKFTSYILSFFIISAYWIWHHNLFSTLKAVSGKILLLNLLSLLTVSIMPFTTALVGDYPFESITVFIYSFNVLVVRVIMSLLESTICRSKSELKNPNQVIYNRRTNILGIGLALAACILSLVWPLGTYITLFISRLSLLLLLLKKKRKI